MKLKVKGVLLFLGLGMIAVGMVYKQDSGNGFGGLFPASGEGFVYMDNGRFYLDKEPFHMMAVNYHLSLFTDNQNFWVSPSVNYNPDQFYGYHNRDSARAYMLADLNLIKSFGFNSVRVVSIGEWRFTDQDSTVLRMHAARYHEQDTLIDFTAGRNAESYFNALSEFFKVCDQAGVKVVLLVKMVPGRKECEEFLGQISSRFSGERALMAYDLYNEPLYFDFNERTKYEVHEITSRWHSIVRQNAPHQLTTIGLEGIREVFEWDPNILDLDFISLHPYEYEPEQVRNEIFWYGKYIDKPWVLGETAIPADGDSVPYENQRAFAAKTIRQTFNCGAIGYTWWQYKDVRWEKFHSGYMGLVNQSGETREPLSKVNVKGTPKSTVGAFRDFKDFESLGECVCLDNYYNYSPNNSFRLKGFIVDKNGHPIEGGVVLAWNEDWTHSYHTVSKSDGSFELMSDYPFYHWRVSATYYDKVDGHLNPGLAKPGADDVLEFSIDKIYLNRIDLTRGNR